MVPANLRYKFSVPKLNFTATARAQNFAHPNSIASDLNANLGVISTTQVVFTIMLFKRGNVEIKHCFLTYDLK